MSGDSEEATIARQQNGAARAPFLLICTSRFVMFVLRLTCCRCSLQLSTPETTSAHPYILTVTSV
jgi:hypothetical protein